MHPWPGQQRAAIWANSGSLMAVSSPSYRLNVSLPLLAAAFARCRVLSGECHHTSPVKSTISPFEFAGLPSNSGSTSSSRPRPSSIYTGLPCDARQTILFDFLFWHILAAVSSRHPSIGRARLHLEPAAVVNGPCTHRCHWAKWLLVGVTSSHQRRLVLPVHPRVFRSRPPTAVRCSMVMGCPSMGCSTQPRPLLHWHPDPAEVSMLCLSTSELVREP